MINYHEKLLKDSIEANTRYLLHAEMNESEIRECNEKIRQYTEALDNLTSSSRIIHSHPKQGHFYWVKDNDDSGYEVAYVRHYFEDGCARFEFVSGGMKMQSEISDWKREPLLYKG